MALQVSPRADLDNMVAGEEYAYELDLNRELGVKTVNSYTYKIYNSSGAEVTSTFGGGSIIAAGVITFGIIAASAGKYTLEFIITCNELLPDGSTPYEFYVSLTLIIV